MALRENIRTEGVKLYAREKISVRTSRRGQDTLKFDRKRGGAGGGADRVNYRKKKRRYA